MLIGSYGCAGTGGSATCEDLLTLLYLPKSLSDCEVWEDEEGVIDRLLLSLCECLDLLDFFLRLEESEEADLEVEEEEKDDWCLRLYFFICDFF